jgi:uncharacterized protein YjiS (DUF1127 family)
LKKNSGDADARGPSRRGIQILGRICAQMRKRRTRLDFISGANG